MPRLLIATKNAHKTEEIRAIIGPDWEIVDLTSFPEIPAPDETGATFAENAAIKALAAAASFPGLCLADDSGLEVDLLQGAPGVRSARYAGPGATDGDNRCKLLAELGGRESAARFRCAMALACNGEILAMVEGTVQGRIITKECGVSGFGYDSLFVPEGRELTFGEASDSEKNTISHRARAFAQVLPILAEVRFR